MLRRQFDLTKLLDVVLYLRMSDDKQNPLSPEQQEKMIRSRINRSGLNVKIARVYRDDGLTGRMTRNRKGFLKMIHEIQTGQVNVDAILVDTIERFGRMEELDEFRRRLEHEHNIVILTADKNFSDPTSSTGRVMAMFENYRATVDSEIKAHNVLRAKYLTIEQNFWPGGPVPFGYRLDEVERIEKPGARTIVHNHLVPDEGAGPIMQAIFQKSKTERSWGQERLAKYFNAKTDIPDKYKPFIGATIGRQLKNAIYQGELVWDQNCTGIVRGVRVLEANSPKDVIHVPDFCEPLVSIEDFQQVQANRIARTRNRKSESGERRRGINYRYPLTGLVRCGHCNVAMNPNSSSYKDAVYTSYICPKNRSGMCDNATRVPEEWLRETVVGFILKHLIPNDDAGRLAFVEEVTELVRAALGELQSEDLDTKPVLAAELATLGKQMSGWIQSLSNPKLSASVRELVEMQMTEASSRRNEIEEILQEDFDQNALLASLVRPEQVHERLDRLSTVLSGDNATEANLFLSMHVDKIDCFNDGRVRLRVCKVGSSFHAVSWFANQQSPETINKLPRDPVSGGYQTKPRRRGRPRVEPGDSLANLEEIDAVTDPNRFRGLPEDWFWVEDFQVPERSCWAKDNAEAVLARYNEIAESTKRKPSCNTIAKEFDVSRPTILNALDFANGKRKGAGTKHRREPKIRIKGNPDVEKQIEELHAASVLEKDIAAVIGVSRSAITAALIRLYEKRGVPKPDGRRTRHQR
ncbi:hypothetical protein Q31b_57960 [Novipirellula aureliae]|uniref:Recombinase domain-containing protein n=1 Tax=Novipirellula aureliae TaxID=2527966 RepID=A0A5C6DC42_9BACT|nr:recombinase family protein [Novipirellula aureliae]TWU32786.1 hypothetical protein Q31b_57960 [Novipirellula aureliae]